MVKVLRLISETVIWPQQFPMFLGGLGRAVLVGACLTLAMDVDATPTEVISQMRALRGPRAVQSVKQYNFINEYRDLSINEEQLGYRDDDNESCVSR